MDVDSEPLSSQDNVEDCMMTGVKENVNCTCDCGGSSSECVFVTADDIINQTIETLDAAYNLTKLWLEKTNKRFSHTKFRDPSVVKTKGAPKGKKERGKRRCNKCNSTGHVKNKCPVRNDGDDLGDKTGSGTQASFGTEEELPKDLMASQEILAVPNTEGNAPVQQEFGLGDSGLINGHETPIPPYGSHQWLL
ncbi:hypothetical protein HN51_031990 [Arachis hypogaea]